MNEAEQDQLNRRVDYIRSCNISQNTKNVYRNASANFLKWLRQNKPILLTDEFLVRTSNPPTKLEIKNFLDDPNKICPIKFSLLGPRDFFTYVVATMTKANGGSKGTSSSMTQRAALFSLYRDYGLSMSLEMESELKIMFRGLKRETVKQIADGFGNIKTGKHPMDFAMYRFIGLKLIQSNNVEFVFARCFLILCWNLMCRAGNIVSVCYSHLEWKGDALGIYFAHMKNDQLGERPRDARHIFANPLMPEICPILALGLYWLCFPIDASINRLFPGNNQYDRFRNILVRILDTNDGKEMLLSRGIKLEDIGTHSMRKGASTYVSSGSTACPPSVAVHIRAGWALGGVQDRYLRYEAAGDMYVGRTVSGLPIDHPEFALLPPMFVEEAADLIQSTVQECFPQLPPALNQVAEFALASLVFHQQYLMDTMPKNHRVFGTPLFTNQKRLENLGQLVTCRLNEPTDTIRASGIPPHVSLLSQMTQISNNVQLVIPELRNITPSTVAGVVKELEDRAIGAGTVTREGMESLLNEILQRTHLNELWGAIENLRIPLPVPVVTEESIPNESRQPFMWNDSLHRVPQDFEFPDATPLLCWQLWLCGDDSKGYPPYKTLRPKDMPSKNHKKRLADFRYLMEKLEHEVRQRNAWPSNQNLTIIQVNQMFEAARPFLDAVALENRTRTARPSQLKWTTMVKRIRQKK